MGEDNSAGSGGEFVDVVVEDIEPEYTGLPVIVTEERYPTIGPGVGDETGNEEAGIKESHDDKVLDALYCTENGKFTEER